MATNRNGQEPPTTMWDIALPSRWRSRRRGSSNSSTMMNGNSSSSRSVPSQDFELQRNKDRRQSHQHLALKRGDYTNTTTTRSGHHHRGSALPRQTSTKKFGIRKKHKVWGILAGFFVFFVVLVLVDVTKNRRINRELFWDKLYMRAVVSDYYHWQLGWRLEDLAWQADNQKTRMTVLLEALEELPPLTQQDQALLPEGEKATGRVRGDRRNRGGAAQNKDGERGSVSREILLARVLAGEEDLNRIVSVECITRPNKYVQVGMHPMVASAEAGCKVFSAAVTLDAHSLFEKVELGEGRFALRAFSNRRFLRVVPPETSEVVGGGFDWSLEVGAPEVGLPEVFQMRDGMVYSEVMHGYLSCSGQGSQAEIKGFVGEHLWQPQDNYQLVFNQVSGNDIERARALRDMSDAINTAQQRQADEYIAQQEALVRRPEKLVGKEDGRVEAIAICVPMTSRRTLMKSADDSPVWTHAIETFLLNTDWKSPKFTFHWYFGFDYGDPIYDEPNAATKLKVIFYKCARQVFIAQGLSDNMITELMGDGLTLKLKYYTGMEHAPSHVVSALIQDAYDEGCDFFYQINDDTVIISPDWAETFTRALRTNPLGKNVGVTGPIDTNNLRILTHAFVHRTHIDIFGRYFPVSFRNWWSDDWISNVYGQQHTLRNHLITVTHDVHTQKSDTPNRYEIDFVAEFQLVGELQKGHVRLSKWLRTKGLPPPLLPMVCGYAPLTSDILYILQKKHSNEKRLQSYDGGKRKDQNTVVAGAQKAIETNRLIPEIPAPHPRSQPKIR